MKKFLSKMPVMIVFLSLAVVGLVFYIVMLARPVSYGMTYSITETATVEDVGSMTGSGIQVGDEVTTKIKFKNDTKATVTIILGDSKNSADMWIYRQGNKVAIIGPTLQVPEEEYDQYVEQLKANEEMFNMSAVEINAFRMAGEGETEDMVCNGAIVFAVVWGVVEVALITFGALSLVFFLKNRKGSSTQSADTPVVE
mgnify:FL=1